MHTLVAAMARILRDYGCSEIYGIGGDYAASLIQGLDPLIELCPASNETSAAYSACASAELHGVGCCLTTFMVGSIPCLSAAALAMAESLAVVFVSGCPGESEVREPVALHHSLCNRNSTILQYDNALGAFSGLGVRAERLSACAGPGTVSPAEHFADLVRHAVNNRQPVFVEVPRDIVFSASLFQCSSDVCSSRREPVTDRVPALADDLRNRLIQAHYPIVYFGDKLKQDYRLRQLVLQFCQRYRIPFVCDPCAKGLLDEQEPMSLGVYNGVFSDESTRRYIEQRADFVLEIGTSRIPRDICVALKTGTQLIHGSSNTFNLGIECVCGGQDESDVLEHIMQSHLHPFEPPELEFEPQFESEFASATIGADVKLTIDAAMNTIAQSQKENRRSYIFLPEVGSAFFASFRLPTAATSLNRGWLSNPWYGAMGTSLSYARVVCRAIKRNDSLDIPIVITGDGGLHFQLNELAHFQREHLSVLIVVIRNNTFALGKSSDSNIYECCAPDFRVDKMIEAYGGKALSCSNVGSLRQALNSYTAGAGLMLIEILVDQNNEDQPSGLNDVIKSKTGCRQKPGWAPGAPVSSRHRTRSL